MVVRVASVPSGHVYVQHLTAPEQDASLLPHTDPGADGRTGSVRRLPDPPVAGAPAGQWWPSPVLTPAWLRAHVDDYDVVHVHFGFEHLTTVEVQGFADTLRRLGRPLVLTVHDLANPHLTDQAPHLAALDVLIRAAVTVLTLTEGAAREITRRWGVKPVVLPHPHVVPLERMVQPRPPHEGFTVGLQDKQRAGTDPDGVRPMLTRALREVPDARFVRGPGRWLTDDELSDYLAGLDVLVLPYRHGTHSGMLEACHDLGTAVIVTDVGHHADQAPVQVFTLGDAESLSAALRRTCAARPAPRASVVQRRSQRGLLARAHQRVYATAIEQLAAA